MNIIENKLTETHYHQRRIEFDGAEPEAYESYTHKGKQWVPDTAHARWTHGRPIEQITLHGYILKKDGTPGVNRGEIRYATPDSRGWDSQWDSNAPQWLLELFADSPHTAPEGAAE